MSSYTKGILHSNGETLEFTGDINAKRLRDNFPSRSNFFLEDRTKEIFIGTDGSAFLELIVDSNATPLPDKPQCDNWEVCSENKSKG